MTLRVPTVVFPNVTPEAGKVATSVSVSIVPTRCDVSVWVVFARSPTFTVPAVKSTVIGNGVAEAVAAPPAPRTPAVTPATNKPLRMVLLVLAREATRGVHRNRSEGVPAAVGGRMSDGRSHPATKRPGETHGPVRSCR